MKTILKSDRIESCQITNCKHLAVHTFKLCEKHAANLLTREIVNYKKRLGEKDQVLRAIIQALEEPAGGEYWTARKLADEWSIFNDDLEGNRVLLRLAQEALKK